MRKSVEVECKYAVYLEKERRQAEALKKSAYSRDISHLTPDEVSHLLSTED